MNPGCSVIVPIDLSRRPIGLLRRLRPFLDGGGLGGPTEVVIAHLDYGSAWDRLLARRVERARRRGARLRYVATPLLPGESGIPLGRLRNIGVAAATGPDLLFSDVDLILPRDLLAHARALRDASGDRFVSIPVVYLSRHAERHLPQDLDSATLTEAVLSLAEAGLTDGIALNSSLILVDKAHYERIGGFDETYRGHGFEDFDLLMRLATHGQRHRLPPSVLVNRPTPRAIDAVGFRSFLSRHTLPALARGLLACHVHHWRPKGDGYFEARIDNYSRFRQRMLDLGIVSSETGAGDVEFDDAYTARLCRDTAWQDRRTAAVLSMEGPAQPIRPSLRVRASKRCDAWLETGAVRLGGWLPRH